MTTRPVGKSMYNVFCGSNGRQSEGCDAARTSAIVLPAAIEFADANNNGTAANAIRRSDFDMASPRSSEWLDYIKPLPPGRSAQPSHAPAVQTSSGRCRIVARQAHIAT